MAEPDTREFALPTDEPRPERWGRAVSWPFATRRRRWVVVAVAGCLALVLGGVLVWPDAARLVPGTLQAGVLAADEVSTIVGTTLGSEEGVSEPPPALRAEPAGCAAVVGPMTRSVYGDGWTAFWAVSHQESEAVADHVVTQVVARYPDRGQAEAVFRTLGTGVTECRSAVRVGSDEHTSPKWFYAVDARTSDTVAWTAVQQTGDAWACHRRVRVLDDVVVQVAVCQAGDGRRAATDIADRVVARVRS
ncbi:MULTISPECIES: sensor domain-containing protein [Saccharothrix]|uniref:sensor domain-containing protein n=1 Tax=Saccharothrix TaxID=2071 RepID=UPI00093A6C40|nr:sensor domain-containing protein [Saccharothrix sp. CB00851]OKI15352.1 hypothetical protein A6A25_13555 [Saccharothrix sp. CB00851]